MELIYKCIRVGFGLVSHTPQIVFLLVIFMLVRTQYHGRRSAA